MASNFAQKIDVGCQTEEPPHEPEGRGDFIIFIVVLASETNGDLWDTTSQGMCETETFHGHGNKKK